MIYMTTEQDYHNIAFRPETYQKFQNVKELKFGTDTIAHTKAIHAILTEIENEYTGDDNAE